MLAPLSVFTGPYLSACLARIVEDLHVDLAVSGRGSRLVERSADACSAGSGQMTTGRLGPRLGLAEARVAQERMVAGPAPAQLCGAMGEGDS